MPRIRALSEREAELLKKRGLNPAQFGVSLPDVIGSEKGGQIYDLTKMEEPGIGASIASGLRSVTKGFASAPIMGLHAIGGAVEGATKLLQRPFVGPDATGWQGVSRFADAADDYVQETAGEDPRVSKFVNIPGQAVGQVGGLMSGVGIAGNAMRLTPLGARVLGSVAGAGMAAGDTIDEELDRQRREGEERAIGQAVGKGAIVGAASYPLERMGVGKLFGSADDAALRALPAGKRMLSIGGRSAATEGAEEGLQYGVVEGPEGTFDPRVAVERVAGGALGGFAGGGIGALGMDVSPLPGEATEADEKAIVDQARALAQQKPKGYETPTETIDAMESAIRTDTMWKPVGKLNPVDTIFEELRKAKVPLLREDIEGLYQTWGGNNANLNQLQEAGRKLYERGVSGRTGKVIPTPDLVAKQHEELEKYDTQIANVRKRYDALTKAMADEDTKLATAPAGDKWQALAARDRALRANEIAQLETQMETLVAQKELMLGKQRDTRGDVNRPVVEGETERGRSYPVMNPAERMAALQALPPVQGEVQAPVAPRPLEGVPIEEGPVTTQTFPPLVTPGDVQNAEAQAAAAQASRAALEAKAVEVAPQAAEAVARAQARMAELQQRAAELAQDPRGQSPIAGVRQQVESETAEVNAELEALAPVVTRPPLKSDRSIIERFMKGQTVPGMEGEQSLPFEDEGSEGEMRVYNSGLPLETIQNLFKRLKGLQRGRPELLGTRFPKLFQGSIDYPLEHIGDLIHRLAYTEKDGGGIEYGREAAQDKIRRALRYAEDAQRAGGLLPYVRAVAKQNFNYFKTPEAQALYKEPLPDTFEEAWPALKQHLNEYALAHSELPAMSEYQKLAQEATVALGRLDTETYVAKLKELDTKLKADNWKEKWYAEPEAEERWNSAGNTYYSGVPVDLAWRGLKEFGKWSIGKLKEGGLNPFNALYYRTKSVKSSLGGQSPLAAYLADGMDGMWRMRDQLEYQKMAELDEFKDFLGKPEVVAWINDSIDSHTENYDALPAKLRPMAEKFMEFNRSFIQDMIDRDQYVRTGNDAPRLPEMIPGHVPTAVSKHVWDELSSGDPALVDKWQKVWVDSWRNQRPQDSEEQALAAFDEFAKPVTAVHAIGGEPLFSAARKAHGINLPREMREQDIYAGYQRYISKSARDTVWTEKVQKDPLMRRALGVKLDHHFEDHSAEDRLVQPTELQWRKMLRQGKRVNAKWMANLKPGQNLGLPLLVRDPIGDVFLASFNETPANRIAPLDRGFNDFSQLAGSLLMETTTGIRDATFGNTELAAYVPSKTLVKRWGEVVSDYAKYRDKARKAGAVRADVYRHQAADVMSKAAYKTAKTIRDATGRQLLDEYPRVFAYHAVYEQVMSDLKNSGNSPLVDEFGEIGDNLSFEEQAEATAAAVVNRIAPNYDVRSLPKAWVPQTRGLVGMLTQLSTFGIARYNTWYEDHYQPAVRDGKPGRLMRSALFGVVGAAAAGALIDELFKKKPAKMSWQEWMGLSTEEQQKEFAPLLFGLIQSQGMLGIMGDLTLPLAQFGNRLATGGGPPVSFPDLGEASVPGLIIMDQVLMTAADFVQYASSKGWKIDKYDLADLGNEFMKTAQVWRDMQGWFSDSERDVSRERRTYERLSGKSAITEGPIERPLMSQIVPRLGTRFSVSREFNTRQGPALQSLMPVMEERAMQGKEVRIASRDFTDEFWQDVARRRGLNTAKAMYEKVQKQREYEPIRRDLAGRLNSVR